MLINWLKYKSEITVFLKNLCFHIKIIFTKYD